MFIPRIYYPHAITVGSLITLDKENSHYLITVLRLKNDDSVILFNGEGGEFSGQCHILKKSAQIFVLDFKDVQRQSNVALHLGQALVRGDRMDLVIQKATELGVTSITPLLTARCAVKMDEEKSIKRHVHWEKIAISACEQCGRTEIPKIHPVRSFKEWIAQPFNGLSIGFDIQGRHSLKNLSPMAQIRLAIGPESGWLEEETHQLITGGFINCQLGPRILRTETAAIAAVSIVQALFGDL